MRTYLRRINIFLVFSVFLTLGVPGLIPKSAMAHEPENDEIVFYEIKPKAELVKFPELPPKPIEEKKVEAPKIAKTVERVVKPAVAKTSSTPVKGKIYTVTVTAYSSTVDQTDGNPFITASGSHVHWGTVAANFLPFGTKVRFPDYFGDQVFTIEDRTARKYSNRADIWFPSRGEALQFGKRTLRLEVL